MLFLTGSIINNVLILFLSFVIMLYLYFKWSYTYWSRRNVITPACSFPLGNVSDVLFGRVSVHEMFKEMYISLKPKGIKYFGYYLLRQPVLIVIDIELIKLIMIKDFSHFTDHGIFNDRDDISYGANLFSLRGIKWKTMREKLTPLFTSGKLKMMFSTIEVCSTQLASLINQYAKNSEKLNIKDIVGRYTTDVIASVAFGIEINSLENPNTDFRKYGERASGQRGVINRLHLFLQMVMPNLTNMFRIPVFPADVSNFFLEIVKNTIQYREANNVIRNDFMQLMIQLKNNIDVSGQSNDCFNLQVNQINEDAVNKKNLCSLSIEEIVAQAVIFYTAGYETSSSTIAFCMFELAHRQDIQEILRDEIQTVLNKHEGKLSYGSVMEMTYMEKCIKETLRKYSVLPNLFRQCTKTYRVPNSDFIIEKDMILFIPISELHYDPEYYPNPEKFDPERFSSENMSTRNSFSWLPFGEGPRVCIGTRLAMIQIKVALATLLKDFRYSLDSRTSYPLKLATRSLYIAPEGEIWLNVEKIIK